MSCEHRISAAIGKPFADGPEFKSTVVRLLDANVAEFTLEVETHGHVRTTTIHPHSPTLAAKAGS